MERVVYLGLMIAFVCLAPPWLWAVLVLILLLIL